MLPIVAQYFSNFGVKHGIIDFIEQKMNQLMDYLSILSIH
jgi:hypothetical protein